MGRRPPRAARRARRVRPQVQEVAHGRPADRARPLQARRARRALARSRCASSRRQLERDDVDHGRQRLRRRPRGRADLRLPLREGRREEAGPAAVAVLDDQGGDAARRSRDLRPAEEFALARGGRALALGGRLDRRHERHARGDDPPALVVRRRRLARPRADADARDRRPPRGGDPRVRARALLARRRDVRGRTASARLRRAATTPARSRGCATRRGGRRRSSPPSAAARATITKLEKTTRKERAPLLYDLTSLQREANTRFGFSARRTLGRRPAPLRGAQGAHLSAHELALPDRATWSPRSSRPPSSSARQPRVRRGRRVRHRASTCCRSARVVNDEKVTDHHAIIPTRLRAPASTR